MTAVGLFVSICIFYKINFNKQAKKKNYFKIILDEMTLKTNTFDVVCLFFPFSFSLFDYKKL